jgi:hypothetical protein
MPETSLCALDRSRHHILNLARREPQTGCAPPASAAITPEAKNVVAATVADNRADLRHLTRLLRCVTIVIADTC